MFDLDTTPDPTWGADQALAPPSFDPSDIGVCSHPESFAGGGGGGGADTTPPTTTITSGPEGHRLRA